MKLCKDCKHYVSMSGDMIFSFKHGCKSPELVNPCDGTPTNAELQRSMIGAFGDFCGRKATYFEAA